MALFHVVESPTWDVWEKEFAIMQRELWNKEGGVTGNHAEEFLTVLLVVNET